MTSRNEDREKFQRLLRELFQFDCADLDFGIYRIMNYKRDVIEKFITTNLPHAVAEELDRGLLAEQSQAAEELKEVSQQIGELLGRDALDADGNPAQSYHDTPLGEKYQNLKAKAADGRGREALEVGIFNHLYTFFRRYDQDGDFISKRRYSKRQRYAIPYNGEEVCLYWANNDQYHIKTAEHIHDYTFTSRGVTTHFKLQTASVEQNNVKIEFEDSSGQQALEFDDYLLRYMLKWESRRCATPLNVDMLTRRFHYKLRIHADGRKCDKIADRPETFNYLLGVHVQTRQVHDDGGRRYLVYRGRIDDRRIVVIRRENGGWQEAELERDKELVAEQKLTEGADDVFVNGDSFIPSARALEPVFKARMFAGAKA